MTRVRVERNAPFEQNKALAVILVAVGSNLPHPDFGSPLQVCEEALKALQQMDLRLVRRSRWFETAPIPASDQPNFINGVVEVASENELSPRDLLKELHRIEALFGRTRERRNEARLLDLDIIDFNGRVTGADQVPVLPHARMRERAFVLYPLQDVAPNWHHPESGESIDELIYQLPEGQGIRVLA
ncbi:2-amino-4-hydroxy-6-hydroxymethyldihydropteridine diphosphokinase [Fodinicurvata fenggangensis]|uniref:2-amino-4-hydroxy-6- hydroxymethyldihydropteridine diphosphokinase n=1 Tax=Fodinicurvata fenggangensis TaxID=1121830 RepID=UPI001B800C9A|nr:2-amino-4-hydroxy-6-hydroxymethyldihydropteridine diphosphokinase [Fodinicurvata fenggangensis]